MPRLELAERRDALRAQEPRLYPRDVAARLAVTEADLLALDEGKGGEEASAVRLRPDFVEILQAVGRLGPVMALTRNGDAVHEKTGTYGAFEGNAKMGLFVGEAIDLRLFLSGWRFAWQVVNNGRRSLQFYGADGSAAHKIFAVEATDLTEWTALVARFAAVGLPAPEVVPPPAPAVAKPDSTIDTAGLLSDWDALRDTHHFHGMLRRHGVTRTQALRLAGPTRARPVDVGSLRITLERSAAAALPIMVFVGNRHCIQIHTGPVQTLKAAGPWFNVLDPGFNLHLRETSIVESYVVTKPTEDGPVTSLELFDVEGESIATLFGRRKPGLPESLDWRALVQALV
jgi:putative hemin transport protein